jgi:hypothetical protein
MVSYIKIFNLRLCKIVENKTNKGLFFIHELLFLKIFYNISLIVENAVITIGM